MRSKQYFTSIENNPHENSTEPKKGIMLPKQEIKKSVNGYYSYLRFHYCWTTRIRTWTNRTKTCCATITP